MLYYVRKLWSYISLFFLRGVLSDNDIKKLLGYHIFIYPFKIENLKPSSYNLTASKCAFIKEKNGKQKLIVRDNKIIIPANKTAIIETQESIYVSKWITGTYHSRVKLANKGIGHIGTTLDPCFFGLSAIALHNETDEEISINIGDSIATIMFYSLKSRSSGLHDNMTGRLDDGIKLEVEDFYNFEDKNKKVTIVINKEVLKNIKIDDDYIKENISVITENKKLEENVINIYDIDDPVCQNCINCNNKEKCSFKLLKNIISENEKRAGIIKEIEEWKSQQWINNKESLIEKVKESVRKENNNKDILIYSLLILIGGIILISWLILLVNSGISKEMVEIVKVIIGVIIPTVTIIIGMIVNHKSKKGD